MDPFLGEIRLFSWAWTPQGWLPCDGRLMPIGQYQALAALLGTMYGGDGRNNFALPDLRGRAPIHFGPATTGTAYVQGQAGGCERVVLSVSQIPAHIHTVNADSNVGGAVLAANNLLATPTSPGVTPPQIYASAAGAPTAPLSPTAISTTGGNQPHDNRQPYLAMNYCIAALGLWPPRD